MTTAPATGGSGLDADCYEPAIACLDPLIPDGSGACRAQTAYDCLGNEAVNWVAADAACKTAGAECTAPLKYDGISGCIDKEAADCTDGNVFMTVAPAGDGNLDKDCYAPADACPDATKTHDGADACRDVIASDCNGGTPSFVAAETLCKAADAECTEPLRYKSSDYSCIAKDQAFCANLTKVFMAVAPSSGGSGLDADCYTAAEACPQTGKGHNGVDAC